jgi:hypothetical protein
MKIAGLTSASAGPLQLRDAPKITERNLTEGQNQKTIGETPPVRLSLSQIGSLAALFNKTGFLKRLERKLNHLKKKNCKIVPADGTVACVDEDDIVYLGVGFLKEYQNDHDTIAGVLAHEWGHTLADRPKPEELEDLNWDQIFELRRAHETLADESSGRLLFQLGYKPNGIINFLLKGKETHNHKYHPAKLRAKIVLHGYKQEYLKSMTNKKIFNRSGYKNEYDSILLDIS